MDRRFWKDWPRWVKVIAVIWMLLPLFLVFLDSNWNSPPEKDESPQILFHDVRSIMLVLSAWYGVFFLIWRTILAEKQTQATEMQTQTVRENHYTDLFTKAVEQLGATRQDGEPAIETRIGAIYALERIAKDSERDYGPIIETLAAYIREYCCDPKSFDGEDLSGEELEQAREEWIDLLSKNSPAHRSDVAAALTVLSRRNKNRNWISTSDHETQPDFTGANFQGANLIRADLSGANFQGANLSGATLWEADLSGANLSEADLSDASLIKVNLWSAYLSKADLSGAYLLEANLSGAYLLEADLSGANLANADLEDATFLATNLEDADLLAANLKDANLRGTDLTNANLTDANFTGADLAGALLTGAQLENSKGLTEEMIQKAFGDGATSLPNELLRPAHWGSEEEAIEKWQAFCEEEQRRLLQSEGISND